MRSATYVDRILKGAKPGDLAVERYGNKQIVINPAKALGMNVDIAGLQGAKIIEKRRRASDRLFQRDHVELFGQLPGAKAKRVRSGSWLCKNAATRDDDRINLLPSRV